MKRTATCVLWSRDDPAEYAIAEPAQVPSMLANGWTATPPATVEPRTVEVEVELQPARWALDDRGRRVFEPQVTRTETIEKPIAEPPPFAVREVEITIDGDPIVLALAMVDDAELERRRAAARGVPRTRRGTSETGDNVNPRATLARCSTDWVDLVVLWSLATFATFAACSPALG